MSAKAQHFSVGNLFPIGEIVEEQEPMTNELTMTQKKETWEKWMTELRKPNSKTRDKIVRDILRAIVSLLEKNPT